MRSRNRSFLLLVLLLVQASGLTAQAGGIDTIRKAVMAREEIAKRHRVVFQGIYTNPELDKVYGQVVGYAEFSGEYEKWIRYELEDTELAFSAFESGAAELLLLAEESLFPDVRMGDGQRSIAYTPMAIDGLGFPCWEGLLSSQLNLQIRRGPLHAGLLFSERWLSEQFAEREVRLISNQGVAAKLELLDKLDDSNILELEFDESGALARLQWSIGGASRLLMHVQSNVIVDGLSMPQFALVVYDYNPLIEMRARIEYEVVESADFAGIDLLSVPAEIARSGGVGKVFDRATGAMWWIGEDEKVAMAQELTNSPSGSQGGAPGRKRGGAMSYAYIAAIAALSMLVAVLMGRRWRTAR